MMISIITPTNNPMFLKELEESILSQSYRDWEWIVLLNQGAKWKPSSPEMKNKVKIIECPFVNDSVGFLKRLACMQAGGEITAEVDHDDILTSDCLAKVAAAFGDPEVGFVYSKNAKLSKDFRPYLAEYGWTHSSFRWKGRNLYAMDNQPLFPGRLGNIYFAPDHIRAWRTSVYESIGGHDDSLKVCDDLDLMHRLYKVTKFKEIPEVLYIYRINGSNTFIQRGKLIKENNEKLYDKNIESLAERFVELSGLEKIDVASVNSCGDIISGETFFSGVKDNSVGLIKAYDSLQYVINVKDFMSEVHRVLAPGGILLSETPSTDGRGAFQEPNVRSFWNENSFWYYTRESLARKIGNKRIFRECKLATVFKNEFNKEHRIAHVVAHLEKL